MRYLSEILCPSKYIIRGSFIASGVTNWYVRVPCPLDPYSTHNHKWTVCESWIAAVDFCQKHYDSTYNSNYVIHEQHGQLAVEWSDS